jgi:hypothetical protein
MIKKVVSKFSNGLFTQRLQLARMPQSDTAETTAAAPALVNQPIPETEPADQDPPSTGVDTGERNQAYTSSLTNLNRKSLTSSQVFKQITTTPR